MYNNFNNEKIMSKKDNGNLSDNKDLLKKYEYSNKQYFNILQK